MTAPTLRKVLAFDPAASNDPELREVFADEIARAVWLTWRGGHLVNQYFQGEVLEMAAAIRAHAPIVSWPELARIAHARGSNFENLSDCRGWAAQAFPYVIGDGVIEYVVDEPRARVTDGRRDGETFDASRDAIRLGKQAGAVFDLMRDGEWRTLAQVATLTGHPEASVSARLRDLRKPRFGGYSVERENVGGGTWRYRLLGAEPAEEEAATS